jgi:hypothetical protein
VRNDVSGATRDTRRETTRREKVFCFIHTRRAALNAESWRVSGVARLERKDKETENRLGYIPRLYLSSEKLLRAPSHARSVPPSARPRADDTRASANDDDDSAACSAAATPTLLPPIPPPPLPTTTTMAPQPPQQTGRPAR